MTPEVPNRSGQSLHAPSGDSGHSALRRSFPPTRQGLIPDHELLKRIGRGSYGEVWLAKNKLGTFRAVKIVYRSTFEDGRPFEREFKGIQKFEPISRSHEGLVDILQVGGTEDYFYYVMELADDAGESPKSEIRNPKETRIPNDEQEASDQSVPASGFGIVSDFGIRHSDLYVPRTLREEVKQRGRLPAGQCIEIGRLLASALAHLHAHGLVHRDVKPSNIIFVNGVPKLADIGLVAEATEARSFVGTEGFIPPEGPGSQQADLYSLGKVLYEIGTGHDRRDFPALPPDIAASQSESRAKDSLHRGGTSALTSNSELEIPNSELDQAAFLELNAVVVKACKTEPRERYQTANEMLSDFQLLQQGRSVKRRRVLQRRWAAGKRLGLAAIVLFALAALLPLVKVVQHRATPNSEAVRLYYLGREQYSLLTDESFGKSLEYLTNAIKADPEFVEAYVALFELSGFLLVDGSWDKRYELQKDCAGKLMKLAPGRGESHAALSWIMTATNNWAGAEAEIKKAIKLSPKYAWAHMAYGRFLCYYFGRPDEATEHLKRAQQLDSTSPVFAACLGLPFYAKRQFPEAIAQFRKALELRPNCGVARMLIGKAYEASGDYTNAIAEFEAIDLRSGADEAKVKERYRVLRQALTDSGPHGYWEKVLEFFQENGPKTLLQFDRYDLAGIYGRLGEKEKALQQLADDAAKNDLNNELLFEADYDSLRDDPRFWRLVKKIGLAR